MTSTMMGGCHCGSVRYELTGAPAGTNCCHCKTCRKASGTAFATNAAFPVDAFRLLSGDECLVGYASSPGKHRHFCGRCGSPIYSSYGPSPAVVYIRVGSLDDDAVVAPDVHIHVGSKAAWFHIRDSLPQRQEEEDLWF